MGMPPFIVTLALMIIIDGVILAYTLGYPIYIDFPSSFVFFGQGYIGKIPVSVIIMIAVFIFGYIFLNHLKIGRYFFAFGGNKEAARLSGINTKLIGISSFILGSAIATIAGIVLTAKLAAGLPNAGGLTLTLDAYTATILGGTSLAGGKGTIYGAIIGVLLIGVINNGLILYGIPYYFQNIVKGLIILMAVAWNSIRTVRSVR
ncbi:MAG: ABC transporter permease [Actinobacteria bacterium]|nr:ABC transporter permease [Actinomycetota bacterium]